jgi:hypothetical protein
VGAAERVAESVAEIYSDGFADAARMRREDFSRRRKIGPGDVVGVVACRRGAAAGLELRRLRAEGLRCAEASPSAFSRARRKVSASAVASLAGSHAARVYRDGAFLRLPGGLVPVAVDGTTVPVPTNAATLAAFGAPGCNAGSRPQASMGLSCAYDPLNCQILSLEVCPGSFDERAHVARHVERARAAVGGAPLLVPPGRGYPSLPPLAGLAASGALFVARCGAGFLAGEFRECRREGGDLDVEVGLTRSRLSSHPAGVRDALAGTSLRLRLAVVPGGGGRPDQMIATNVPRSTYGSPAALAAAYAWRWPVETCFQKLKGRMSLETSWTSPDPEMLAQGAHVTAWVLNMAEDLAAEATARAAASGRGGPGVRASLSACAGALRQEMPALLRADRAWRLGLARALVEESSRHLVPVREGRSSPREGLRRGCGRRPSNTHKPAL